MECFVYCCLTSPKKANKDIYILANKQPTIPKKLLYLFMLIDLIIYVHLAIFLEKICDVGSLKKRSTKRA